MGRAAHPTSKRGFAPWVATTTIPRLFQVDVEQLTSALFWDRMDRVSPKTLRAIEARIMARAVQEFGVRNDLRQLALALLVSPDGDAPLGSYLYRGNRNDVSVFAEAFGVLREPSAVCAAPQLKGVLKAWIEERKPGCFDPRRDVDSERYDWLCQHEFGRRMLAANRQEWTTKEIVLAHIAARRTSNARFEPSRPPLTWPCDRRFTGPIRKSKSTSFAA